jgi:hypothetical protein
MTEMLESLLFVPRGNVKEAKQFLPKELHVVHA